MEIKMVPIADIIPYENNPRKNTEAVKYVKNSIKQFGFKIPMVLDAENVIVCGHTRYLAAQELGMLEVPCTYADDLTEEQIKAFRLADNKTAEIAEWDDVRLEIEISDIVGINLSDFGFELEEDIKEDGREREIEEEMAKEEKGEVPFTEYVDEVSQYVVLKFKSEADWNYAQNVFALKKVRMYSTRTDGKENGMMAVGVGRVIDGMEGIRKIEDNYKKMYGGGN